MLFILYILGLVFLFLVPPLGMMLLIIAIVTTILKLFLGTGKTIISIIANKKCPYCKSTIKKNVTICPICKKELNLNMKNNDSNIKLNSFNNKIMKINKKPEITIDKDTIIDDYKNQLNKINQLLDNKLYTNEEYYAERERLQNQMASSLIHSYSKNQIIFFLLDLLKVNLINKLEIQKIKEFISSQTIYQAPSIEYTSLLEELDIIYSIYNAGIYTEIEYSEAKLDWFNDLENCANLWEDKENNLLKLLPFKEKNILTEEEIDRAKYIISGKFRENILKMEEEKAERLELERIDKINENKELIKSKLIDIKQYLVDLLANIKSKLNTKDNND